MGKFEIAVKSLNGDKYVLLVTPSTKSSELPQLVENASHRKYLADTLQLVFAGVNISSDVSRGRTLD